MDENLQKKEEITIPQEGEKIAYTVTQDEQFLYIIQKTEFEISKKEIDYNWTLFKINISDFSNFETHVLRSREAFSFLRFYPFKANNGVIAFYFGNKLADVQITKPKSEKPESLDLSQFEISETKEGTWGGPYIVEEELRFLCTKRDVNGSTTVQDLYFDENAEVIKQLVIRTDLETNERTTTDEDGNETVVKLIGNVRFQDIPAVPYPVKVNGEDIWIKNTYKQKGYIPKIEATWISRDSAKPYLNLTEHLKKEMKASGVNKSTGMNMPIIYADPVNNSIIVQYWVAADVEVNGIGKVVESFV